MSEDSSRRLAEAWQSVTTAPLDRDLEVAVIDGDDPVALTFPCRRGTHGGWVHAHTGRHVDVAPSHWRPWRRT